MSTAVQRRRGTNTEHNSFTGLEGEISVNTTNESVHVHDGSTAGGFEMARADMDNVANIDDTIIGATTPAAGTFTTFTSNGIDDNATSNAITIDSSENVGIGTSSPEGTLQLENASNNALVLNAPANRYNSVGFQTAGTDKWWLGRADSDQIASDAFFIGTDAGNATDAGGLNAKLVINTSGNVGIGESDPQGLLHVEGYDYSYFSANVGAATLDNEKGLAIGWNKSSGGGETVLIANQGAGGTGGMVFSTNTSAGSYNERMRIDGSGNVGIGTSVPGDKLHVKGDDASILIQDSTTGFANQASGVILTCSGADGTPRTDVQRKVRVNGDALTFTRGLSDTEHMRIDSSGNVLVGGTSAYALDAATITAGGQLYASRTSANAVEVNRSGSDGEIIRLQKAGATVGSIGTVNGDMYLGTGDTGLFFSDGSNYIMPYNVSTPGLADGLLDLGRDTNRFKNLYLSGGVYLGGTGSANLLDDYEEGTFSAQIRDSDDDSIIVTSTTNGAYTKIGRVVHVSLFIFQNSVTSHLFVGYPYITMPFSSGSVLGSGSYPFYYANIGGIDSGYLLTSTVRMILCTNRDLPFGNTGAGETIGGSVRYYDSITYATN